MKSNISILIIFGSTSLGFLCLTIYKYHTEAVKSEERPSFYNSDSRSLENIADSRVVLLEPIAKEEIVDLQVSHPEISILSSDNFSYRERLTAFRALNWAELTLDELVLLKEFLVSESSLVTNPAQAFSLRNNVLSNLLDNPDYARFAYDSLIEVLIDKDQHNIWREYVLQHYSIFLRDYRENSSFSADNHSLLVDILYDSLDEFDTGISGTALLNFKRLKREIPELVEGFDYQLRAIEVFLNENADLSSRISAIGSISTENRDVEADDLIAIIVSPSNNVVLKMAALRYAIDADKNEASNHYDDVILAASTQPSTLLKGLLKNE